MGVNPPVLQRVGGGKCPAHGDRTSKCQRSMSAAVSSGLFFHRPRSGVPSTRSPPPCCFREGSSFIFLQFPPHNVLLDVDFFFITREAMDIFFSGLGQLTFLLPAHPRACFPSPSWTLGPVTVLKVNGI